jgi:ATP-dependent exoDNAse (exonuclease V) alpha subunit
VARKERRPIKIVTSHGKTLTLCGISSLTPLLAHLPVKMICEICKQQLDPFNIVKASPAGKIGGNSTYCNYCYHCRVIKLADSEEDMLANLFDCLTNLSATERKRLVAHLTAGKKLMVGPDYHSLHAVYNGIPSISVVASGSRVSSKETRREQTAAEQEITTRIGLDKDGDTNLLSYLVIWMTPAQVLKALTARKAVKPEKKASKRKRTRLSVLDDLF